MRSPNTASLPGLLGVGTGLALGVRSLAGYRRRPSRCHTPTPALARASSLTHKRQAPVAGAGWAKLRARRVAGRLRDPRWQLFEWEAYG
ncbi:MAG TPA: hypothetical protein VL001_04970 [Candidimonas sp.]|nr:hypothetical protein [Candidimonas sp.]